LNASRLKIEFVQRELTPNRYQKLIGCKIFFLAI
jgi:hypothetical protein